MTIIVLQDALRQCNAFLQRFFLSVIFSKRNASIFAIAVLNELVGRLGEATKTAARGQLLLY